MVGGPGSGKTVFALQALVNGAECGRLVHPVKTEGIAFVCTSLLGGEGPRSEGSLLAISTVADIWIHLSYVTRAGERNRALSIVKSRGTGHSNQVQERLFSDQGVSLTDAYTEGGEVLMGTLRWERGRGARGGGGAVARAGGA